MEVEHREQPDSQPVAPDAVPEPASPAAHRPQPDAAVAILRTRAPEPSILLMRRAERHDDPWSGHWSLPGGRKEACDLDLIETALRELEEECGIQLPRAQMCAALGPAVARRRTGPFVTVAPFVFDIDAELPTVLDPREAVAALWIPERRLLDPGQHVLRRVSGLPPQMLFPSITLPGAPLWGFTYRLLLEWLGVSPQEVRTAAHTVAQMALDFVVAQGARLRSDWHADDSPEPALVARVDGPIPAAALIDHISAAGPHVPKINAIEVTRERVVVVGLAFEQYRIEGTGR